MKRLLFVFNPNSGKAQIKNHLLNIVKIFSIADYEVVVYPTKAPNDGYEHIVKYGKEFDVIVCSGGDGTLNETVGAVMKIENKRIPIGYIPAGSTNDFAVSLGIPTDMNEAARNVVDGQLYNCDIGMTSDDRTFNYVAAFGAFTEVSYATPQNMKNVLGHQAYIIEGFKEFLKLKPIKMKVETDEQIINDSFLFGMVSNTSSVGGMKGISGTDVDLQDGLFEITLVKEIKNPIDFQNLVTAFVTQNPQDCNMLYTFKTSRIAFESEEDVKWTLDGEYGGTYKNISYKVVKSAVDFIVPSEKELN